MVGWLDGWCKFRVSNFYFFMFLPREFFILTLFDVRKGLMY